MDIETVGSSPLKQTSTVPQSEGHRWQALPMHIAFSDSYLLQLKKQTNKKEQRAKDSKTPEKIVYYERQTKQDSGIDYLPPLTCLFHVHDAFGPAIPRKSLCPKILTDPL